MASKASFNWQEATKGFGISWGFLKKQESRGEKN